MTSATKWRVVTLPGSELMQIWNDADQVIARISTREQPGAELPDATLIAEAGTVHHECGLSPRELQERCSAMEAALQHCEQMLMKYAIDRVDHEAIEGEALEIIRGALAKHKEV